MGDVAAYVFCDGSEVGIPEFTGCGQQPLTKEQYMAQLLRPNSPWRCPSCGMPAEFDDEASEALWRGTR
jgi:hypothetical protein